MGFLFMPVVEFLARGTRVRRSILLAGLMLFICSCSNSKGKELKGATMGVAKSELPDFVTKSNLQITRSPNALFYAKMGLPHIDDLYHAVSPKHTTDFDLYETKHISNTKCPYLLAKIPAEMQNIHLSSSQPVQKGNSIDFALDQSSWSPIRKRNADYDQNIPSIAVRLISGQGGSDSFRSSESEFRPLNFESHISKLEDQQSGTHGEATKLHKKVLLTDSTNLHLDRQSPHKIKQQLGLLDQSSEFYGQPQHEEEGEEHHGNLRIQSNLQTEEILSGRHRRQGTLQELSQGVEKKLTNLANTAHLPHPRLGLDSSLDPLISSSTLRYVHEGDLLQLRLVLKNVTLTGLSSLSVQEVDFISPLPGYTSTRGLSDDTWEPEARGSRIGSESRRGDLLKGIVRIAFTDTHVSAKYQVRGSARGFFTFKESGNLTLTSPNIFLTSRLVFTKSPAYYDFPIPSSAQRRRHGSRAKVKVVKVRSEVSLSNSTLLLRPTSSPPQWVRQQVQSKLEELTTDLSHGHGAVRLLLRRWGRALKRLIHKTARTTHD